MTTRQQLGDAVTLRFAVNDRVKQQLAPGIVARGRVDAVTSGSRSNPMVLVDWNIGTPRNRHGVRHTQPTAMEWVDINTLEHDAPTGSDQRMNQMAKGPW